MHSAILKPLLLGMVVLTIACKARAPLAQKEPDQKKKPVLASEVGQGFIIRDQLQGLTTVSGEKYDTAKLTAAHRNLPFGTKITVQDVRNGATVIVRVNDRSLPGNTNIIGLSKAAAKKLGVYGMTSFMVKLNYKD